MKTKYKKLLEFAELHPDIVVRDFTMHIAAPDAGLKTFQGWVDIKDGDMVLIASFMWKSKKAKNVARNHLRKLLRKRA